MAATTHAHLPTSPTFQSSLTRWVAMLACARERENGTTHRITSMHATCNGFLGQSHLQGVHVTATLISLYRPRTPLKREPFGLRD